jgi:hypothetical protein
MALVCHIAEGQAVLRIAFDFNGVDPSRNLPWTNTSTLAAGWSTTGWTMGDGLSLAGARDDRLGFMANSTGELTTLTQAITSQQHLAVSIATTNMAGHRVTFAIRRESWHAPLRYAVRSSVDSFASNLFNSALLENADDATDTFTFLLPTTGWTNLIVPVEFRIIPYAARFSGHPAALSAFQVETAAPARTLAVSATVGGTAASEPDRSLFEQGETVALRASPEAGYKFTGWIGAISGRGNPRTITITNDMTVTATFARKAEPRMQLGGNLDAVTDYTTAWVFKNVFSMARPWLTREVGSFVWESNQAPPVDTNGWPIAVPFSGTGGSQHYVHTLVPLFTSGVHTIRFAGSGSIELIPPVGGRIVLTNTSGVFQINQELATTADSNTMLFEIRTSSSNDPVRNIEIITPGEDPDLTANLFHSAFLASLAPYRVLRFMDWLRTNGNEIERWSDRTTRAHFTQAREEGVAHEFIIQLCNLTRKHAWICIPHRADDDYVRQTARLYRDTLDLNLVLYVEYSNETWNNMGDFTQTPYVQQRAGELGITANEFVARRSAEIFGIFADEYGAEMKHRYVNVIATQAGFIEGVTRPRLAGFNDPAINNASYFPDALAIAPYFGVNYEPGNPVPSANEMVTTLSSSSITESISFTLAHQQLADEQGLRLVCYEGGQHFTGIFGAENDTNLIAQIHLGNRDPRMADRYAEYLSGLESAGVDLFANFTHIGEWSKWGAWGVLEYQQQPASEAPKWRALNSFSDARAALRERIELYPPLTNQSWALGINLRPDETYSLEQSTNLITWTSVPGLNELRGDAISARLTIPDNTAPLLYWRLTQEP